MADIVVMMLWQVVLFGGWTISRRLRRLERTFRSPCPAQVGALREQVVALRGDHDYEAGEQGRRVRDLQTSTEQTAAEVRLLLRRQERCTRLLMQRLAQLEQRLGTRPTPRVADRVG